MSYFHELRTAGMIISTRVSNCTRVALLISGRSECRSRTAGESDLIDFYMSDRAIALSHAAVPAAGVSVERKTKK